MISASKLSLSFGPKSLFKDVNIKFNHGNCYGLIGANGSGKSTFLKVLSGEIKPTTGEVFTTPGERLAVLKQDHFAYEDDLAIQVVIKGHQRLWDIMSEKEALYAKGEISDQDGERLGELEAEFAELDGWEAESEAGILLSGLGIDTDLHQKKMKDLQAEMKIKVLLAQALFGKPEILLLDEPTNHLDIQAINWLEEFLYNFENIVIVVSHDRHFLNRVCTHIADIDFNQIRLYVGNYDFWYQSSQLALRLTQEKNKKTEAKISELKNFISRFSANASKAKQATSRQKLLEKLTLDDIQPSLRKYPYINFQPERELGNEILRVEGLSKKVDGEVVLDNISFTLDKKDKVVFVSESDLAITLLFDILNDKIEPDSGEFQWGLTTKKAYFPKDNKKFFESCDLTLVDWLRQYSPDPSESFVRGFLGKMLFSGDDALKKANVLSGGEKVRCMMSKLMMSNPNVVILDEPTNHLDLESITSVNNGLIQFKGVLLFSSQDHELLQTVGNRVIRIDPDNFYDKRITFDEYLQEELEEVG